MIARFAELVRMVGAGRLALVCDLAEPLAPFFWTGGTTGFTSGLATVAPELSLDMFRRLRDGNISAAKDVWERVAHSEQRKSRESSTYNMSGVKATMCQMGVCGRTARPPSSELHESERG